MLWSLAIVPVRQRQNQTRPLHPFDLARRDKLVNDALGVVREITKLRFPDDQSIGRRERISVLETETGKLAGFFAQRDTYTPYSLREELEMTKLAWSLLTCCRGV